MNQHTDYTPVALYARVSSDRQDVDLSISAQLRVFDVNYFCRLCRLFLPVLFLLSTPLLGHAGPVAGHVEF